MNTQNSQPPVIHLGHEITKRTAGDKIVGPIKSSSVIKRHPDNPVLTSKDVPYESTLTYNAGIIKYQGKYVMVFRNDVFHQWGVLKLKETNLGLAFSNDGIKWEVQPKPCFQIKDSENRRAYDPRLTVIDGRVYMCFAVDTYHGLRGGIAVTADFEKFEVLYMSVPDNRNMVLFPEKIGGVYVRLERPFPMYSISMKERFDVWVSESPDMKHWGNSSLLLRVEDVPFANIKIGPGAPPVKTNKGWLTTFHAVDYADSRGKNGWEPTWKKRYTAGIMLLDLNNPHKIVGISKDPLMVPEVTYETDGGLRNNVIFPGGMILEDSGEVKIYYGSADTCMCLATANVDDLLNLCLK